MSTTNALPHSSSWLNFTYASFVVATAMVSAGIIFMPVELWVKAYMAMGCLMLVQSCVTLTKTARDNYEASKLVNRIEDARTERLLMAVDKSPM